MERYRIVAISFLFILIIQCTSYKGMSDLCKRETKRLQKILKEDVIAQDTLQGHYCLLAPVEEEMLRLVEACQPCLEDQPKELLMQHFTGKTEFRNRGDVPGNRYSYVIRQCYNEKVRHGTLIFKIYTDAEERIDSLSFTLMLDGRNLLIKRTIH